MKVEHSETLGSRSDSIPTEDKLLAGWFRSILAQHYPEYSN
jgi:hypothetical protein